MRRLRGVNFGGWFSQIDAIQEKDPAQFSGIERHLETFLGEADFARIQQWDFNHVRLPVDYFVLFDEQFQPYEERMALLEQAIRWAVDHELFLILDLHKCPGNDFHEGWQRVQTLFTEPDRLETNKRLWAYLAERFGSHAHVLLEILNEPVAPDSASWNQVKNALCAHIRRYAPHSPIIIGSNRWNMAETFADLQPVDDANIIYNVHVYNPMQFTHQLAPWVNDPSCQIRRPYPGDYGDGEWNQARLRKILDPVIAFRRQYQVPVMCNEFGVYVQAERASQLRWLTDLLDILKAENIGFSYWNYKNLDFGILSRGEQLHANLLQYQNPQRLDQELIELLQMF